MLVWFGLISFPLYLWHWPLLSFLRIVEGSNPEAKLRIAALVVSILLAWLTYKLIEKPIRFGKKSGGVTTALLSLMIAVGFVGYYCYQQDGFEGVGFRDAEKSEYARHFTNSLPEWGYFEKNKILEKLRSECDFYDLDKYRIGQATKIPRKTISENCFKRDTRYSSTALIWGDSHAQALYPGLVNNLPDGWQTLQVTSSGCAPDITVKQSSDSDHCVQSNWFALKTIKEVKPNIVIVGQNVGHSAKTFNEIADGLKNLGVNTVLFVGPTPHWTKNLPVIIMRDLWKNTPNRTFSGIDERVLIINTKLKEQFGSTDARVFVNLIDFFCNEAGCLTYLGDDKKMGITSWDYGHLTPVASDHLARNLLVPLITGIPPLK